MKGKRNIPNYVEIQTDGHITVRRVNAEDKQNVYLGGYSSINQYGNIVVMPPEHSGYFTSFVNEVQNIYVTIES